MCRGLQHGGDWRGMASDSAGSERDREALAASAVTFAGKALLREHPSQLSRQGDDPRHFHVGRSPARFSACSGRPAPARRRFCASPPASRRRPSGRVLLNDQEIAGPKVFLPPERRGVGLMFQDFALFPAHVRARQRPLRPDGASEGRGRSPRRVWRLERVGLFALCREVSACAVRRRAAARGPCPGAGAAAGGPTRWTSRSPAWIRG